MRQLLGAKELQYYCYKLSGTSRQGANMRQLLSDHIGSFAGYSAGYSQMQ
jgi:hypothetical protein